MKKTITSNELKLYKKLSQSKYRKKHKLFLIEGFNLIEEALKAPGLIVKILSSAPFPNSSVVSQKIIDGLSQVQNNQGIIAICNFIKPHKIQNKILVLENINDPGNLGALIRSAQAFGFSDIVISGVDLYNDKVIRASQGALFMNNIIQTKNIYEFLLKNKNNHKIIGTHLSARAIDYRKNKIEDNFFLVLGNEANGITDSTLSLLDENIIIPIAFESLNVAIAGSIIMAHFSKV